MPGTTDNDVVVRRLGELLGEVRSIDVTGNIHHSQCDLPRDGLDKLSSQTRLHL